MKKIVFLTPRDATYGFSLAGVLQQVVDAGSVEETISARMADPDIGIIIVDERLREGINEERLREQERRWSGVLLMLPAPEEKGKEVEDYLLMLIRRAIGYHVRITS